MREADGHLVLGAVLARRQQPRLGRIERKKMPGATHRVEDVLYDNEVAADVEALRTKGRGGVQARRRRSA